MVPFILGFLGGGVFLTLFFRVNPKLAVKFFKLTDKIEKFIEDKTGKDI